MPATTFSFLLECMKTPIGDMLVVADEQDRLRALGWADLKARLDRTLAAELVRNTERICPYAKMFRQGIDHVVALAPEPGASPGDA